MGLLTTCPCLKGQSTPFPRTLPPFAFRYKGTQYMLALQDQQPNSRISPLAAVLPGPLQRFAAQPPRLVVSLRCATCQCFSAFVTHTTPPMCIGVVFIYLGLTRTICIYGVCTVILAGKSQKKKGHIQCDPTCIMSSIILCNVQKMQAK